MLSNVIGDRCPGAGSTAFLHPSEKDCIMCQLLTYYPIEDSVYHANKAALAAVPCLISAQRTAPSSPHLHKP
jgi:hypothetical protein